MHETRLRATQVAEIHRGKTAMNKPTDAQLTSQAASWLGSLAKGKPKRITPEDSKRRSLRLAEARKRRWAHKREKLNVTA
jgi:hypothetical protein